MGALPSDQSHSAKKFTRGWMVAAAIAVALVVAVAITALVVRADRDRPLDLSSFPRNLVCVSVPQPNTAPGIVDVRAPDPVLAQSIRINDLGAQRIEVVISFADTPPPAPQRVPMPGYPATQLFSEAGSMDFTALIFPGGLDESRDLDRDDNYNLSISRGEAAEPNFVDGQWTVTGRSEFMDDTPAESITIPVESAKALGNTIAFTIDLAAYPPLSAGWTPNPDVIVYPSSYGYPTATNGGGLTQYQRQNCTTDGPRPDSVASPDAGPTAQDSRTPAQDASTQTDDPFAGSPVSPGACASTGICQLSSPSGDYYCTISRTGAFCSPPLGEPLSTDTGARLIKVGSDGETGLLLDSGGNSHMQDRNTMQDTTFAYGQTMTAYGMTCAFDPDTGGARCRHDASGHGFDVNTRTYGFF
ncbi:hypothetical protein [Rhodococcoides fascians]|uniref:hypothetical protein n=1 Tax=Rhodococcoides fascians TaxID=1828 RepID=UPI0012D3410F|nr:hypothetical protein [Rhodococcus fascians]